MNSNIRKGLAIVFASAALVAAGCGSDSSADNPEDAVSSLYGAIGDGDAAKACDYLTADAAQRAADEADADNCEDGVQAAIDAGSGSLLGEIEVGDADVDGDSGTVEISFAGETDTVNVIKEDGSWKVDQDT